MCGQVEVGGAVKTCNVLIIHKHNKVVYEYNRQIFEHWSALYRQIFKHNLHTPKTSLCSLVVNDWSLQEKGQAVWSVQGYHGSSTERLVCWEEATQEKI